MMNKLKQQPSDQQYKEEEKLLKEVKKWLEPQIKDGIQLIRITDRYHRGYSDLFINARGKLVCAELKDDKGVASPHQLLFIEEVQKAGGQAGVCRSVKEVQDLINAALYCSCWYGRSISKATSASPRHAYKYCPKCGGERLDYRGES